MEKEPLIEEQKPIEIIEEKPKESEEKNRAQMTDEEMEELYKKDKDYWKN